MRLLVALSTVEAVPGTSLRTTAWIGNDGSPLAPIFTGKNQNCRKTIKHKKETTPTCSVDRKKLGKRRMVEDLPQKNKRTLTYMTNLKRKHSALTSNAHVHLM